MTGHATSSSKKIPSAPGEADGTVDDGRRLHRFRIGDEEFLALSVAAKQSSDDDHVHLTAAEQAIAKHLRAGLSNRAIAELRGGSERTVANQVASILRKYGLTSRAELVVRAHASGAIGEPRR